MLVNDALPWRGSTSGRPVDLERMPLVLAGRPRKRWKYAAVFGERLMLCAGVVEVAGGVQTFWAVWDRERGALRERTRLVRGKRFVGLPGRRVRVDDGAVRIALEAHAGVPVETVSHPGAGAPPEAWIWTRKQGAVRFTGTVELAGEAIAVDALGCTDESAGFHARETAWRWSAGVGELVDGRAVGWNLVDGLHDAPAGSERSAWILEPGAPSSAAAVVELPRARFADDLSSVATGDARLAFSGEATRARRDDLLLFRSDYEQPFGTFTGSLPGGLELAAGRGVMERHTARW